jgi:heme-degrading monooxygenase HmoA
MVRIVKMTFKTEEIPSFLALFDSKKNDIAHFPGCQGVRLLNDVHLSNVFYTYSHWENPEALEEYRKSALFEDVWSKTKIKFSDRPEAWSLETIQ